MVKFKKTELSLKDIETHGKNKCSGTEYGGNLYLARTKTFQDVGFSPNRTEQTNQDGTHQVNFHDNYYATDSLVVWRSSCPI
jgi:hypothetical protein